MAATGPRGPPGRIGPPTGGLALGSGLGGWAKPTLISVSLSAPTRAESILMVATLYRTLFVEPGYGATASTSSVPTDLTLPATTTSAEMARWTGGFMAIINLARAGPPASATTATAAIRRNQRMTDLRWRMLLG